MAMRTHPFRTALFLLGALALSAAASPAWGQNAAADGARNRIRQQTANRLHAMELEAKRQIEALKAEIEKSGKSLTGYEEAVQSAREEADKLKPDQGAAQQEVDKLRGELKAVTAQIKWAQGKQDMQPTGDAHKQLQAQEADIKKRGSAAVKKLYQAKAALQAKLAAVKKAETTLKKAQARQKQLEARLQRTEDWLKASESGAFFPQGNGR